MVTGAQKLFKFRAAGVLDPLWRAIAIRLSTEPAVVAITVVALAEYASRNDRLIEGFDVEAMASFLNRKPTVVLAIIAALDVHKILRGKQFPQGEWYRPNKTSTERARRAFNKSKARKAAEALRAAQEQPLHPASKLLMQLREAAEHNTHTQATDETPIAELIDEGCDLDLDVLPAIRKLVAVPEQPPLKNWGAPWLVAAIRARRDGRLAPRPSEPVQLPERAVRPAPEPDGGGIDVGELVAGFKAGMVSWNAARLGPAPGEPGCRIDAQTLRENGF